MAQDNHGERLARLEQSQEDMREDIGAIFRTMNKAVERLSRIEGRLNGARRWQAGAMSGSALGGAGVVWALQKVLGLMSQ